MTGVGDLLPPKSNSLDKPEMRRVFFRHTQSTIWDLALRLNDEVDSDEAAEHLYYVCQLVLMLGSIVEGASKGNRAMMVYEIVQNHESLLLEELGMYVPDPESSNELRDTIERLMCKHTEKALNAYAGQRVSE